MTIRTTPKPDTRTALLQAGMDIMLEKGYSNSGIQEILARMGVPKGSFYHYFTSKEDFALEIIRHCDEAQTTLLHKTLRNPEQTPLARLQAYCDEGRLELLGRKCRKGCLIGNLSQEMADQSEVLRQKLSTVMSNRRDIFASCIEEGQAIGQIGTTWKALELAEVFLSGWAGAVMHSKTLKNIQPVDTFVQFIFSSALKSP